MLNLNTFIIREIAGLTRNASSASSVFFQDSLSGFFLSRFRAFALSRFRAFALSRIRAFAHSRFRAFALSRFRAFALSRAVPPPRGISCFCALCVLFLRSLR
ncbi:MAG: hypothetical protein FWF09_03245 [Bacteroidales bacterium]|nr:hypothetical protein [Bacteroidales bacterium]